jgi:hypothetical protein
MDKPCFDDRESLTECSDGTDGKSCHYGPWEECRSGKKFHYYETYKKELLAKARKIREEVCAYLHQTCWALPAYPEIKAQLTKIIKKHL